MGEIFVHFAELFWEGMGAVLPVTALIGLLLLFTLLFGGRYKAKTKYILWTIVMLRLALPWNSGLLPPLYTIPIPEMTTVEETISPGTDEHHSEEQPIFAETSGSVETDFVEFTPITGAPMYEETHPTNATETAPTETTPVEEEILPVETVEANSTEVETGSEPSRFPQFGLTIFAILGIVWGAGAVGFFAVQIILYLSYMRSLRRHLRTCDETAAALFVKMCQRMRVRHCPELYISPNASSPMLCGYLRPMIVLPDIPLTENSLAGIFAHELTHYRRGDIWWKLLTLAARALHWWNPMAHLAAGMQLRFMELSCDEAILADFGEDARRSYGNVMLEIIRKCRGRRSMLTTQFNPKTRAVWERFEGIMDGSAKKRGGWILVAAVILSVLAGSLIACRVERGEDVPEPETESETVVETDAEPETVDPDVHEFGGYTFHLPEAYRDKVMITRNVEFTEDSQLDVIGEVYHVVNGERRGLVFAILRDTEPNPMLGFTGGLGYFAKDAEYYYYTYKPTYPTYNLEDPVESTEYLAMSDSFHKGEIEENFIQANGLEPYDVHTDPEAMTLKIPKDKQADGSELRLVGGFGGTTSEKLLTTIEEDEEFFYIRPIEGPISRYYSFYRFMPDGSLVPDSKLSYQYNKVTDQLDYWGESPTYTPWLMENYGTPPESLPEGILFEGLHYSETFGGLVEYSMELYGGKDGRLVLTRENQALAIYEMALTYDPATGAFTAEVTDNLTGEVGTMTGQLRAYFEVFAMIVKGGTMTAGLEKDLLPLCALVDDMAIDPQNFTNNTDVSRYRVEPTASDGLVYTGYKVALPYHSDMNGEEPLEYHLDVPQLQSEKSNALRWNREVLDKYLGGRSGVIQFMETSPGNFSSYYHQTYTVTQWQDVHIIVVDWTQALLGTGSVSYDMDLYYYREADDNFLTADDFIRLYTNGAYTLTTLVAEMNAMGFAFGERNQPFPLEESCIRGILPAISASNKFDVVYMGFTLEASMVSRVLFAPYETYTDVDYMRGETAEYQYRFHWQDGRYRVIYHASFESGSFFGDRTDFTVSADAVDTVEVVTTEFDGSPRHCLRFVDGGTEHVIPFYVTAK